MLFVGLPGAGKSSLYHERFASTHQHISKDLWRNATSRDKRQETLLEQALAAGSSVVIDNTNPTTADRACVIKVARRNNALVIGYFFDVTTRAAVARNAERTGSAKVPNVAIFTAAKRLEPPSYAEGFDHLFRATIGEDRALHVSEIPR